MSFGKIIILLTTIIIIEIMITTITIRASAFMTQISVIHTYQRIIKNFEEYMDYL